VNVNRVVAPASGVSAVPSVVAAQAMLFGSPVEVNEKLLLNEPNDTVSVLSAGEPSQAPKRPPAIGLPARANVTEYVCPGCVATSWNSGAFGPLGLTSADWFPLLGFHSPLAALLSISAPPDPANQGPVVAFGKPVFAAIIRFEVVPSAGNSNPQSPTRLPATVEQSGCVV
jgi:hypothetical protein